jgi:hypothetical protein
MWGGDGFIRLVVARELAAGSGWDIPPNIIHETRTVLGIDGQLYSYYGLGISLVYVPLILFAREVAKFGGLPEDLAVEFVTSFVNAFEGSLLCTVFFLFLLHLGYSKRVAFMTTIALGFGTILWAHTRENFDHIQTSLLLLTALFLLYRGRSALVSYWFVGAGMAAGFAFLTRIDSVFFIFGLLLYLIISLPEYTLKNMLFRILQFGLGALPFLIVWGIYNYLRFGNLLETGYMMAFEQTGAPEPFGNSILVGLHRYLTSPGRGLLLYNPIVIVALAGMYGFWKRERLLLIVGGTVIIVQVFFFAQSNSISPWGWGPRQFIPLLPLLLLPLAEVFAWIQHKNFWNMVVYSMLLLSIVIQLPVIAASPAKPMLDAHFEQGADLTFDWQYARIIIQTNHVAEALPATLHGDDFVFGSTNEIENPHYRDTLITLNIVNWWWILLFFYGIKWVLPVAVVLIVGASVCLVSLFRKMY